MRIFRRKWLEQEICRRPFPVFSSRMPAQPFRRNSSLPGRLLIRRGRGTTKPAIRSLHKRREQTREVLGRCVCLCQHRANARVKRFPVPGLEIAFQDECKRRGSRFGTRASKDLQRRKSRDAKSDCSPKNNSLSDHHSTCAASCDGLAKLFSRNEPDAQPIQQGALTRLAKWGEQAVRTVC